MAWSWPFEEIASFTNVALTYIPVQMLADRSKMDISILTSVQRTFEEKAVSMGEDTVRIG